MLPLISLHNFKHEHLRFDAKVRAYSLTKRGRKGLTKEVLEDVMDRSAMLLQATNARARIAFLQATEFELGRLLSLTKENPAYFVSLTPEAFAMPLADAQTYDWSEIEQWVRDHTTAPNYFGMMDIALYTVGPHGRGRYVHFHPHLIAWGLPASDVKRWESEMNGRYQPFVPTGKAVDVRVIASKKGLAQRLPYSVKAPLKAYRAVKGKPIPELPERWFINKDDLYPRDAVAMLNLLHGVTIDKLTVDGGDALGVTNSIAARARQIIRLEDDHRHGKLLASL